MGYCTSAAAASRPSQAAAALHNGVGCCRHTGPEVGALLGHGAGDGGACKGEGGSRTHECEWPGRWQEGQQEPSGREHSQEHD